MKKKIIRSVFVVAFAMVAGYNVYCSQKPAEMSDMALANVEALARDEVWGCDNGCVDNGNGCVCNGWHQYYAEYHW